MCAREGPPRRQAGLPNSASGWPFRKICSLQFFRDLEVFLKESSTWKVRSQFQVQGMGLTKKEKLPLEGPAHHVFPFMCPASSCERIFWKARNCQRATELREVTQSPTATMTVSAAGHPPTQVVPLPMRTRERHGVNSLRTDGVSGRADSAGRADGDCAANDSEPRFQMDPGRQLQEAPPGRWLRAGALGPILRSFVGQGLRLLPSLLPLGPDASQAASTQGDSTVERSLREVTFVPQSSLPEGLPETGGPGLLLAWV